MAKNIGFIGLGHMGLPMATNLCKAGYKVWGYDKSPKAIDAFLQAGGEVSTSWHEMLTHTDVIITMLPSGQHVWEVCLGENGIYLQEKPALHIDCSSIDVETCRRLHQEALHHHWQALDAPVSGGVSGALNASLTFMAGGESSVFKAATPYLQAMGKKIYHTGSSGSGQVAKLCNNMILGISMIAVSEAFILAEKLGLSAQNLFDVVNSSSGQCWAMSHYAPVAEVLPNTPANHDYQPGFASAMMLKDLLLSQQAADSVNVSTSMGRLATAIYQQFNDKGFGHLDFSAIIKSIEQS